MTLADRIGALTPAEQRALLIYMSGYNPVAFAEMLDAFERSVTKADAYRASLR